MKLGRPRLLLGNVIILAAITCVCWLSRNYYYNFFFGPFLLDDAAILSVAETPPTGDLIIYAELVDRTLIDTGWREEITVGDKPQYSDPFFYMHVGDHVMLVQAESAADGRHLIGPISHGRTQFEDEVIADLESTQPQLRGRFLPIRLNAVAAFNVIGYIGLAFLGPAALLAAINIIRAV